MYLTYRLVGLLLAAILIVACGSPAGTSPEELAGSEENAQEETQPESEEGSPSEEEAQSEEGASDTSEETSSEEPAAPPTPDMPDKEAPTLGDDAVTTDSGLQYEDVAVGEGREVAQGDMVKVHYTGWLEDGSVFDTSEMRGTPFEFTVGRGQVIPGWEEGVQGMQPGGKRVLVIPPDLAYGEQGAPGGAIPPNATLTFEVELVEVEQPPEAAEVDEYETTESGLEYAVLEEGSGDEVADGDMLEVHYTGWLEDGTLFDSSEQRGQPANFKVGDLQVEGLNEGLIGMKVGERRQLRMPPELAFGKEGAGNGAIPPDSTVIMEVQVEKIIDLPEQTEVDEYDETTESGVEYAVIEEGEGDAVAEGDQLSLHYSAWLDDEEGTFFDSSRIQDQPLQLTLGQEFLIPGFVEGLAGMKPGEKRQLRIPAELLQESPNSSAFPPDTGLIFDVELVEVN